MSISPLSCAHSAFVRRRVVRSVSAPDEYHAGMPCQRFFVGIRLPRIFCLHQLLRVFPLPTHGFQCSALRFVRTPTMASADFCRGVPTPLDVGSTEVALGTPADLPGYDALTFTLMPVGFTSRRAVQVSGFDDICRLTPPCRLVSASCSSGQRFAFGFLQIRSHPRHPCRSANSSPCRASRGLSPPSKCALPGAQHKTGRPRSRPVFFSYAPSLSGHEFPRLQTLKKRPLGSSKTNR